MPPSTYSTTVRKTVTDATTLEYDEDILYGGARVGGVQAVLTDLTPDTKNAFGVNVTGNVQTRTQLQQDVDLLYADAVVGHLTVSAQPDATLPSGHAITIDLVWFQPPPLNVTTAILA